MKSEQQKYITVVVDLEESGAWSWILSKQKTESKPELVTLQVQDLSPEILFSVVV